MCKAIEDMRNEAVNEFKMESIIRMLNMNIDIESIAKMLDCPISLIADVQNELRQAAL